MDTRVAIHCEPDRQWNAWLWRAERLLQANNIPTKRVCSSTPDFWDDIRHFTHFISLWGQWNRSEQEARTILPIIEEDLGLRCFPNRNTCRMYDNKPQQSLFLQLNGLPTPRAWLFWERSLAQDWAATAPLPLVFKLRGGAGGDNVKLIRTRKQLFRAIQHMFSRGYHPDSNLHNQFLGTRLWQTALRAIANRKRRLYKQNVSHDLAVRNWVRQKHYAYFQEFIPGNDYDTRVLTVGRNAYGFTRNNRPNDFRASGSGSCNYDPDRIDPRFVRIALDISHRFQFQAMAYDFLLGANKEPVIVEMNYAFADWGVGQCAGHWDKDMAWQEGQCWPQQIVLQDLLEVDNLIVPPKLDRFSGYARFAMTDHLE